MFEVLELHNVGTNHANTPQTCCTHIERLSKKMFSKYFSHFGPVRHPQHGSRALFSSIQGKILHQDRFSQSHFSVDTSVLTAINTSNKKPATRRSVFARFYYTHGLPGWFFGGINLAPEEWPKKSNLAKNWNCHHFGYVGPDLCAAGTQKRVTTVHNAL